MWAKQTFKHRSGFTIVELLVVIVVIAILATISVTAFTGVQTRAQDSVRKNDLANIAKALNLYAIEVDANMLGPGSGCGAHGEGSGWWHSTEPLYAKSTRQCLVDAGYQVGAIADPSGCTGGGVSACAGKPRYMILHCQKNAQPVTYVLGQIVTEPQKPAFTDTICDEGTSIGFPTVTTWDTAYGINYLVRVK